MQFKPLVDSKARARTDCAVVGVYENAELGAAAKALDSALSGLVQRWCSGGDFSGKLGDTALLPTDAQLAARVLLVGLGPKTAYGRKQYRKAISSAATALAKSGAKNAALYLTLDAPAILDVPTRMRIVAELFSQQAYRVPDAKTAPPPPPARLTELNVALGDARSVKAARAALAAGQALAHGMAFAKDLANLPPNVCTPRHIAARAQSLAKDWPKIEVSVLDEKQIKSLKMDAFAAVAQGSDEPPRFIICEYRGGRKSAPPVCLIGKGITFDSGGISLKDPNAMDEMKFDMCGAAAVLGVLRAAAEIKLALNLVVLVPTCENMPSGRALKPADVITTMSGQTVEVLNTDAEGRLILCDAITYSRRFKPAAVIDVATLTGACIVALGHHICGLMSNSNGLAQELESAGLRADDRAWRLPIGEDYVEQLKSNFADLANVGGREGGACTAAAFLSKFATDLNWAHLDVAGTAWVGGSRKGATGRPVPLLFEFLTQRANVK